MTGSVRIELLPLGKVIEIERGTPLQDVLFTHGVEFPCGGRGRCKGCKVKVLAGSLPITGEDTQKLTGAELAAGWRLACRGRAETGLTPQRTMCSLFHAAGCPQNSGVICCRTR